MARKKRVRKKPCRQAGRTLATTGSPRAGQYLSGTCQTKTDRRRGAKTRLKNEATKADGTLKKGYRYGKGGRIIKAKK